jgi:hypothetical protein
MSAESPAPSRCDILVVDNGTNYALYGELARHLQSARGLRVVYLTLVPARVAYFESLGIEARALLLSGTSGPEITSGEAAIRRLEERFPKYRLDVSISRDRILRWYPKYAAEYLLKAAAVRFEALLDELRPRLVLGEISWAIEHLFFYSSEQRGVAYRHLLNLPGEDLLVAGFDADHSAPGTGFVGERAASAGTAGKSYFELCGAVKKYRPSLRYFLRNFRLLYSPNDYRQALFYRVRRLLMPAYELAQQLFEALYAGPLPETRTDVLLVLHVQPESTPDYVAPFHADQIRLAGSIAEGLREGQFLYVKDHPNVLSIRNLWRWRQLFKSGRVRLLPRRLPGRELLARFEVVVSIAGTALYECARLGVPAISMSDVFLNELPNVIDGRSYPRLADALEAAANLRPQALTQSEAQAFLSRFGVPAFVHDARIAPDVTNPANVERLGGLVQLLLTNCAKPVRAEQLRA